MLGTQDILWTEYCTNTDHSLGTQITHFSEFPIKVPIIVVVVVVVVVGHKSNLQLSSDWDFYIYFYALCHKDYWFFIIDFFKISVLDGLTQIY